jgi:hypothetical protein
VFGALRAAEAHYQRRPGTTCTRASPRLRTCSASPAGPPTLKGRAIPAMDERFLGARPLIGLTFETMPILGIGGPVVFLLTVVYVFAFLVWDVAMAALFSCGGPGSEPAIAPA